MTGATMKEPLRLMETFRSVFYTPIYLALSGGFFQREGLTVEFSTCPPGHHHTLSALNSGMADIVQNGPIQSIIAAEWGAEVVPSHIIEVNSRDGFYLVGRMDQSEFHWASLRGASLIPSGLSLPSASLKYALKKVGVETQEIQMIEGLSFLEANEAFRRGEGDFVHLPQPLAEQLVCDGVGRSIAALGPENGHIAYTSFAVTQRFLAAEPEVVQRFTEGFYKAQKWLAERDAQDVGDAVAPFFPGVEKGVIIRAVARHKENATWAKDPLLREDGFDTLQEVLLQAGLLKVRQPYELIVRPDFAEKAMVHGSG